MARPVVRNPSIDEGYWNNHRQHVAGIVNAVRMRLRRGRIQMEWAWTKNLGVPFVPWCPECGVVCAPGAGQLAHEQNVHGIGLDDSDGIFDTGSDDEPLAISEEASDGN